MRRRPKNGQRRAEIGQCTSQQGRTGHEDGKEDKPSHRRCTGGECQGFNHRLQQGGPKEEDVTTKTSDKNNKGTMIKNQNGAENTKTVPARVEPGHRRGFFWSAPRGTQVYSVEAAGRERTHLILPPLGLGGANGAVCVLVRCCYPQERKLMQCGL